MGKQLNSQKLHSDVNRAERSSDHSPAVQIRHQALRHQGRKRTSKPTDVAQSTAQVSPAVVDAIQKSRNARWHKADRPNRTSRTPTPSMTPIQSTTVARTRAGRSTMGRKVLLVVNNRFALQWTTTITASPKNRLDMMNASQWASHSMQNNCRHKRRKIFLTPFAKISVVELLCTFKLSWGRHEIPTGAAICLQPFFKEQHAAAAIESWIALSSKLRKHCNDVGQWDFPHGCRGNNWMGNCSSRATVLVVWSPLKDRCPPPRIRQNHAHTTVLGCNFFYNFLVLNEGQHHNRVRTQRRQQLRDRIIKDPSHLEIAMTTRTISIRLFFFYS